MQKKSPIFNMLRVSDTEPGLLVYGMSLVCTTGSRSRPSDYMSVQPSPMKDKKVALTVSYCWGNLWLDILLLSSVTTEKQHSGNIFVHTDHSLRSALDPTLARNWKVQEPTEARSSRDRAPTLTR